MDKATFRKNLPEFANSATYTDAAIDFWLGMGVIMLNACRWGAALDYGLMLFTAHNMVLEAQAAASAAKGGIPGTQTGVLSGKALGKASITYDAQAGLLPDAGHWNLTNYGTRFIQMARMIGSGGFQSSGGCGPYDLEVWLGNGEQGW